MTYFYFLIFFLGIPLIILSLLPWFDKRLGRVLPLSMRNIPGSLALVIHILVAVIYTTPWDNYLVATGVWYYNPRLVYGLTLGYVPIEEYLFFGLQTSMTGLLFLIVARRIKIPEQLQYSEWKLPLPILLGSGVIWLCAVASLVLGWQPGTYLALIVVWALPPILLQLAFGGDILWRHRRLIAIVLISVTVYLGLADSLAIGAGTWTIAPQKSLAHQILGILPLEELSFFLATNTLIIFGMLLIMTSESATRWEKINGGLSSARLKRQQRQP
jgi:lycopene cyclase domain-containing protein